MENSHDVGTYFLRELAKMRDEYEVIVTFINGTKTMVFYRLSITFEIIDNWGRERKRPHDWDRNGRRQSKQKAAESSDHGGYMGEMQRYASPLG